jgi:flagellar biosynthesis activator protein FlaF
MNALNPIANPYAQPDAPVRSERMIEYELFARVTRRLSLAWEARKTAPTELVQALHDNGALWRTIAVDVASSGNGLPSALRARLFYLHEFSLQHARKVLEGSASAEVLIDINKSIMRGLRGEGTAA